MISANHSTSASRLRLRANLCENLRRYVTVQDGGLMVELFDGFSFPIDSTVDQVARKLFDLATSGKCIATRTTDEGATFFAVAVPQGDDFCLVFDRETSQLVTVVDLNPEAIARRHALAN